MMEGWKEYKLGDLVHIKHGYAFKGEYFTSEETNNILLTPGNFKIGGGFKDDKLKYYNGPIPKDYILKEDDVVITMTDLSKMADTLGYSAKVPSCNSNIYLHNQRIGLIEKKDVDFDIDFLYWLLRFEGYQKFVAGSATGATVKHTSPNKIYAFKFKAPEKPEIQRKIAKILSAYDDLIENNLKRIKLLEEMAQITYEEWFVRMKFPGHETAVFDEETGLPEGWKKVKFKEVLKFRTGKLDSNAVRPKGTYDFYTCAKEVFKTNTYCFDGEAILLGGNNATGDFALFYAKSKFDAYQRTYIVTSDLLPLVYVFYVLQKYLPYFQNVSSGAATKFLTMRILDSTKIVIPSTAIINSFKKMAEPIFDNILLLRNENQLLKEARDILLPRLMTGMISV